MIIHGNATAASSSVIRTLVQSLDPLGRRGDITDDSAEILFQSFLSVGGCCEQFWHGQGCPLLSIRHFSCASPTLQGALRDVFWRDCRGVSFALTTGSSRPSGRADIWTLSYLTLWRSDIFRSKPPDINIEVSSCQSLKPFDDSAVFQSLIPANYIMWTYYT